MDSKQFTRYISYSGINLNLITSFSEHRIRCLFVVAGSSCKQCANNKGNVKIDEAFCCLSFMSLSLRMLSHCLLSTFRCIYSMKQKYEQKFIDANRHWCDYYSHISIYSVCKIVFLFGFCWHFATFVTRYIARRGEGEKSSSSPNCTNCLDRSCLSKKLAQRR